MGEGAGDLSLVHSPAPLRCACEVCAVYQAGSAGMRARCGVGACAAAHAHGRRAEGCAEDYSRWDCQSAEGAKGEAMNAKDARHPERSAASRGERRGVEGSREPEIERAPSTPLRCAQDDIALLRLSHATDRLIAVGKLQQESHASIGENVAPLRATIERGLEYDYRRDLPVRAIDLQRVPFPHEQIHRASCVALPEALVVGSRDAAAGDVGEEN